MFRTYGNPNHTDTRRQFRAAFGVGLTVFLQFGHAAHHPFDAPDPMHDLATLMMTTNTASIAAASPQLILAGMACGMPVAHRVMVQYGLTPQALLIPLIATSNSTSSI
jgi:hypothetical protein